MSALLGLRVVGTAADGARHFVVLATLTRNPQGPLAHLVGELLVPPRNATGEGPGEARLASPADHMQRLGWLHHFGLLNEPRVYTQLRDWLTGRPDVP